MKKFLVIILTAAAISFAADKTSMAADKLDAMLYVSIQDPSMEWWFNVPANSAPHISELKKIYYHQEFSIFPFVDNAKIKDGKFSLAYSITMKAPDGTLTELVSNAKFAGSKTDDGVIVACPDVIDFKFDLRFAEGLYKFEFDVKDEISGEKSLYENHIHLQKWSKPSTYEGKKIVVQKVRSYYQEPSPDNLYSIVFAKDFDLEQRGAPNSLNYTHLGFIKAAFKKNLFLLPLIREDFKNLSDLNRAKFILILALTGKEKIDEKMLTGVEITYQQKIRAVKFPDPLAKWDPFLGAAQIDMLWGEFFADGTYKPIKRILNILSLAKDAAFADSLAEKRQPPQNANERDKYMLGRLYKAALKTIAINASRYPLVEQYCAWALIHKDIPAVSYEVLSPMLEHISEMKNPSANAPQTHEDKIEELPKVKMPTIDIENL